MSISGRSSLSLSLGSLLLATLFSLTACGDGGDSTLPDLTPQWNTADFGADTNITTFNIKSLSDFLEANTTITNNAGNYVLNISGDVDVKDAIINPHADTNISLRGGGTLNLSTGKKGLFNLWQPGSTLILRNAVLKGNAGSGNEYELVSVDAGLTSFIMYGGTITGNTSVCSSPCYGGGVHVGSGSFTMYGGTISGNSANVGGGVVVDVFSGGTFTKTGGIIYGNNASDSNKNMATDGNGSGHAVFVDVDGSTGDKYRDSTLGESDHISTADLTSGWNK
ncbi:hypothetical protein FACS1894103_2830 [Campylobacterota bacterium]|nr:hypothetical protein FACS1894103_2830 [Campylobacterota bacterium]